MTASLEAHHLQRRALTQYLGQMGERVIGAEDDFEPVQTRQVMRQAFELVAREVEHLQRVGQIEYFGWQYLQTAGQIQATGANQRATAQLFKGVHAIELDRATKPGQTGRRRQLSRSDIACKKNALDHLNVEWASFD